ncbi:MAG: hypothetical protein DWQ19_09385 [Crenarchaeota archaeon]|nr:MAG: hypothetical protein DWQ19_09385 [Thermoproteota archaeon]
MTASSVTGIGNGSVDIPTTQKLDVDITLLKHFGRNIVFVGKNGNDNNDGRSFFTPFATFGAAINALASFSPVPSAQNNYSIVCLDAGPYVGNVITPEYVHVYAPFACVHGAVIVGNESRIKIGRLINTGLEDLSAYGGLTGVAVQRVAIGGDSHVDIDEIESNGVGGVVNHGSSGILEFHCQHIRVKAGANPSYAAAIGTRDDGSSHIHAVVTSIDLQADNAIGIVAVDDANDILADIGHITTEEGAVDTIGVFCEGGLINVNALQIKATVPLWVYSAGENTANVNATCTQICATDADELTAYAYFVGAGNLNLITAKLEGDTSGSANTLIPS